MYISSRPPTTCKLVFKYEFYLYVCITFEDVWINNYLAFAGSWYKGDVNKEVAEDIEDGYVPPNSDAYTINGQPGDFCPCSNGMWRHVYS